MLDSADAGPGRGRYTVVAFDPVETASWRDGDADPFEGMRRHLAVIHRRPAGPVPFAGGWIGYFAYEAGRHIERLPATTRVDIGLPIARFSLYDSAAVHDAITGQWAVVVAEIPGRRPAGWAEARIDEWRRLLAEARPSFIPPPATPDEPASSMSRARYLQSVAIARDYIAAGDIFQVNLARRETFAQTEPAWVTYLRLRRFNPAAYAAYLAWDDAAILSSSPELFLRLHGRDVMSRPIKGTRPRSSDPLQDAANRANLAASAKDRAELAMIVDLVRNDLGRACEYGSVQVDVPGDGVASPYELEAHPTVHHLVATVRGRLAAGRDAIDLVRACFPGGSITGAPKVRAMEIIDELEPTERSVYTGAIGCFSLDGSMVLNIAIRTMISAAGRIHVYAGGGIVADSVPEDEFAETRAKARGMCRALGVEDAPGSPAEEVPT